MSESCRTCRGEKHSCADIKDEVFGKLQEICVSGFKQYVDSAACLCFWCARFGAQKMELNYSPFSWRISKVPNGALGCVLVTPVFARICKNLERLKRPERTVSNPQLQLVQVLTHLAEQFKISICRRKIDLSHRHLLNQSLFIQPSVLAGVVCSCIKPHCSVITSSLSSLRKGLRDCPAGCAKNQKVTLETGQRKINKIGWKVLSISSCIYVEQKIVSLWGVQQIKN